MLFSLSPLDGRYAPLTEKLRPYFSEAALIRHRIEVECAYLRSLLSIKELQIPLNPPLSKGESSDPVCHRQGESSDPVCHRQGETEGDLTPFDKGGDERSESGDFAKLEQWLIDCPNRLTDEDFQQVKAHEKRTRHDLKAVEYWLRDELTQAGWPDVVEWIHFGLTSEDANNLAYALMTQRAWREVMIPAYAQLLEDLLALAEKNADVALLARTHGQAASPTTVGKEFAVFAQRLMNAYACFRSFTLTGKLNGATGNYNALHFVYPEIDWIDFSAQFVRSLGLEPSLITTQIEPHDRLSSLLSGMAQMNGILLDLATDCWLYMNNRAFLSAVVSGEVGSSTMPHKVNPIDFENAEGNLGLANALADHMGAKLIRSRLQRDLSDSTVLRNLGVAFGHSLLAIASLRNGLSRLIVNHEQIEMELEEHAEVLAEPVQTWLRAHGDTAPYEKLKEMTRGQSISWADWQSAIADQNFPELLTQRLANLPPARYTGLASDLTRRVVAEGRAMLLNEGDLHR